MRKKKSFIIAAVVLLLVFSAAMAWHLLSSPPHAAGIASGKGASGKVIEIFYLPHPPAVAVVRKIEAVAAKHPDFKLVEYDFTDAANKDLLTARGLTEHMPVAVFIGGNDEFDIDGRKVVFTNFPQGDAFLPLFAGAWSYDDLEKAIIMTNGK